MAVVAKTSFFKCFSYRQEENEVILDVPVARNGSTLVRSGGVVARNGCVVVRSGDVIIIIMVIP